jgi:hypothetical protein
LLAKKYIYHGWVVFKTGGERAPPLFIAAVGDQAEIFEMSGYIR